MFNTARLPLPTIEQIRDQRRDQETMRLLLKLRDDLASGIRKLAPESLLALARQYHPEAETDYQAAAMLGLEAMDAMRSLAMHGEDVTSLAMAEKERLEPVVAEAARRALAIPMKLEAANSELRHMEIRIAEREASLRRAGVKSDDIQRLMAEGEEERGARRIELNSRLRALLSEMEGLDMFLQTSDEKHLPKGFSLADVPLRISGRDAAQQHASNR